MPSAMPLTRPKVTDPQNPEQGVAGFLHTVGLAHDPQVPFHVMLMRNKGIDGAVEQRWFAFIQLPSGRIEVRHAIYYIRPTTALWGKTMVDTFSTNAARNLWKDFSNDRTWTQSYAPKA